MYDEMRATVSSLAIAPSLPPCQADLLIVMGSSLKVRPVSLIPSESYTHTAIHPYHDTMIPLQSLYFSSFKLCNSLPPSLLGVVDGSVPQILINREHLPHMTFDTELLGYSDTIVAELCHRLGKEWEESVGVASGDGTLKGTWPQYSA